MKAAPDQLHWHVTFGDQLPRLSTEINLNFPLRVLDKEYSLLMKLSSFQVLKNKRKTHPEQGIQPNQTPPRSNQSLSLPLVHAPQSKSSTGKIPILPSIHLEYTTLLSLIFGRASKRKKRNYNGGLSDWPWIANTPVNWIFYVLGPLIMLFKAIKPVQSKLCMLRLVLHKLPWTVNWLFRKILPCLMKVRYCC